jgi:hypothetical protein
MEIFRILDILEIPHAVFSTTTPFGGCQNYIVSHDDFKNILLNANFVTHRHNRRYPEKDYIIRNLTPENMAEFRKLESNYIKVDSDENGTVYEYNGSSIKSYVDSVKQKRLSTYKKYK